MWGRRRVTFPSMWSLFAEAWLSCRRLMLPSELERVCICISDMDYLLGRVINLPAVNRWKTRGKAALEWCSGFAMDELPLRLLPLVQKFWRFPSLLRYSFAIRRESDRLLLSYIIIFWSAEWRWGKLGLSVGAVGDFIEPTRGISEVGICCRTRWSARLILNAGDRKLSTIVWEASGHDSVLHVFTRSNMGAGGWRDREGNKKRIQSIYIECLGNSDKHSTFPLSSYSREHACDPF